MKNEKIRAAIEKVIELLRTGNIEKIAYASFKGDTGRPSDNWSFLNRLIMYCSETEDARGIRQWNRAGRRLKKETKALYIRVPAMVKTGAKLTNEDGEEEEQTRRVYKHIPVYRVEDTTGAPLEEDNFKLEIPANLAQVAEGLGLEIKAKRFAGAEYGYFSASRKEIALMSPDIKIYLHELAHGVDSKIKGRLKPGQQPDQEIVAELAAEVVGYLLGHKLNGKGRDYIEGYSGGSWKPVFALLDRVQKVVAYIVDKAQIEEGSAPLLFLHMSGSREESPQRHKNGGIKRMSEEKRYLEYETSFSWALAICEIMKADQLSTLDLWNVEDEIREAGEE